MKSEVSWEIIYVLAVKVSCVLWSLLKWRNKLTFVFLHKSEGHCPELLPISLSTLTTDPEVSERDTIFATSLINWI